MAHVLVQLWHFPGLQNGRGVDLILEFQELWSHLRCSLCNLICLFLGKHFRDTKMADGVPRSFILSTPEIVGRVFVWLRSVCLTIGDSSNPAKQGVLHVEKPPYWSMYVYSRMFFSWLARDTNCKATVSRVPYFDTTQVHAQQP